MIALYIISRDYAKLAFNVHPAVFVPVEHVSLQTTNS